MLPESSSVCFKMQFNKRIKLADKLLIDAAAEGQDIILVGSGVWFKALERALVRGLEEHYASYIAVSRLRPLLRTAFQSGGSIQFIDLSTGANLHMIDERKSRVPQVIYLVEDACGVHVSAWINRIKPFLDGATCRVVYLGDKSVKPRKD